MGLFEFLMILISVVIGLAISEILTGVASLLRVRHTIRFHWLHVFFQVGVFLALLQQWWESWDLVGIESISYGAILLLVSQPVILFLIAHLLYPRPADGTDLESYYYEQAPVLWSLVILGTATGTLFLPLLSDEPILNPGNLSGFPMIAICLVLVYSRNHRVHSVLAPMILVLVFLDTWLVNPALTAN